MATAVDASEAALRTFTWKEVAEHNTPSSAWVSIHGYVYDVTEWIDLHPGGADVLLISAGRDVTQVYDSYHKASTAKAYLGKYLIGRLADTELVSFPEPSAFQVAVRKVRHLYALFYISLIDMLECRRLLCQEQD